MAPPRIPLQTLPAFRLVAQVQNLRAAAERLHITPSAVSQQIRLLEDQLGFALFERRGRRVVLNAAGATLQRAVEPALERLQEGARMAANASVGQAQSIRITLLPSFAQRWLLPRMSSWRAQHPKIALEVFATQQLVDLPSEGFHVALRQGRGHWHGLTAERLIDSPLIAVGSPAAARRLRGSATATMAQEPLLGDRALWERWFALDCCLPPINPVADFNDAALMLQAAEQDIGIALARELLAADALRAKTLVRLSPLALPDESAYAYWFAYPAELADWPPLLALREWMHQEMALSLQGLPKLRPLTPGRAAAPRTKNHSRARSA